MKPILKIISSTVSFFAVVLPTLLLGQSLLLNEIVASNRSCLSDEDGDTPDWIEIINTSSATVDLQGFALSDELDDPYKWRFETGQIAGGSHTIIFASDKDRQSLNINWDLFIAEGDLWHYFVGLSTPPINWNTLSFSEAQWSQAASGFGYGDNDDNTLIAVTMSVYMRKSFIIEDTSTVAGLLFHIDYDDGYIAYINGVEFSRKNMGAPGSPVNNTTAADTWIEPSLPNGIDLTPTLIPKHLLLSGNNVIAVEVHNQSTESSDLTALPFLSKGSIGGSLSNLPNYLLVPGQSRFHTNFGISSGGELITLTDPDGSILDSIRVPELPPDISWGRQPDASDNFYYFNPPSPGEPNVGGFTTLIEPPLPDQEPGFYSSAIALGFGAVPPGRVYKYTLDGSIPNLGSLSYTQPIPILQTTVIRVLTCAPDGSNPTQSSFSYFINETPHLPVMSLIFEPGAFFNNDSGIYVLGSNASSDFPYFGSNFWEDWERQVHIEYFENGNNLSYAASAGAKIFGGWSRGNPQRSLALFARSRYGTSEFDYPFFPELDLDSFEALVLRNSGNDWNMSGYRDGFMTGLVTEKDLDRQAFQPVEVYLNGAYWGIYNLREKVNEHFLASHHDLDPEAIDLLGFDGSEVIHGDNSDYMSIINYVNTHALVSDLDFEYIQERVDLKNFIEYQLAQIYFDNQDWPGNNIKFWHGGEAGSKWRWILYDTDFGFSTWSTNNYIRNTLEFATASNGPGWPNPPWSTLLLRKFLTNPGFRTDFILTACDLLNQDFKYTEVANALTHIQQQLLPALPDHFSRWNHNSLANWNQEGVIMNNFALLRPSYMRTHFRNKFNLGADAQLRLNVEPISAGQIRVHSIIPDNYPWVGLYFSNMPLDIRAIALPGYEFSHWEGLGEDNPDLTLSMSTTTELTAVFIPVSPDDGSLVINEINYHSSNEFDCADWLELYNGTDESINLEAWSISDADGDNQFPLSELQLLPDEYLVICSDSVSFRNVHGEAPRILGNLDFNFSNSGELIRLFNPDQILSDSVRYDDDDPWPSSPDGEGPTLELIYPNLDNGLSSSWATSDNLGTPGVQNSRYSDPSNVVEQNRPDHFYLGMAYPNPFNAWISIPFVVPDKGSTQIQIFDIRGRLVRSETLKHSSDLHAIYHWDGNNDLGRNCSTGVYIVRFTQNEQSSSLKVALLR